MCISQVDGKMEGWLYLIRSNRFGLQYSRKRYFILEDNYLRSFKSKPSSDKEVFFSFTLYNTSNHNDRLKFGASSPEEAARWIRSLQDAPLHPAKNFKACAKRKWQPFRLSISKRAAHKKTVDWTSVSCMHMDAMTSDRLHGHSYFVYCAGLRQFKEAKDRDSAGTHWDDNPAIMAVGVVDGTSEAVFRTVMSLENIPTLFLSFVSSLENIISNYEIWFTAQSPALISSKEEAIQIVFLHVVFPNKGLNNKVFCRWDFCFQRASVVEHLDGHTDIVHMQLNNDWLPWGMKRRDLLLRRYWRREDDGTYVILYHSVFHRKCPPQDSYVRARLKSGGFVISPVNQGKESVVKHMLAIDWKFWRSYLRKASARSVTVHMLERVAALRELFRAKAGNYSSSEFSSVEMTKDFGLSQSEKEEVKTEVVQNSDELIKIEEDKMEAETDNALSGNSSLRGLNDASDEFFDVPEHSDDDQLENDWPSDLSPELHYPDTYQPRMSTASGFARKLHDLAVQKKVGYMDLQEVAWEENVSCCYGATLAKDPGCNLPCSWTTADPSTFLIRGESYLQDRQKTKAKSTLMQMVAADWIRSDKREDDLGSRPGGMVQKYAANGGPEFFLIVNMQIPGSTTYGLALYFMTKTPLEETPILERFVNGDDAYRNSRFKLIPYISKGSWIVKQSVGKKACLVGQALEVKYNRGKNYLELGVDVGSSTVARGSHYWANTQEELPECPIGTCRLNHLDVSKSAVVTP
ncbi:pleckstrin homology (PH) and lipid-binding START domains-containing protein [Actinidia rufa]|uniref:Pleckstrin homology (PH) and lipid-binding START domains-containing protein n=1 Tax=Actinidia rufa TaxID=165716 RepID=A0A7J0DDK1_9ERIC|nr:pleckstrin homology (PH) and lipid-binding START domains-containing protein [Actinidia rufa]